MLLKLRTRFDAVMIGAGTMRAERYGRIVRDADARGRRERIGLSPDPLAVIISSDLALPFDAPLFTDGSGEVLIFTNETSPAPDTETPVSLVTVDGAITMDFVLEYLRLERGIRAVLCEGGPHLFGQLEAADAIDDFFLTISPILAGEDLLVVGPTAGGKTEAAALPLLSRMAEEEWSGLSTLYISPLRALANDIEMRLGELFGLLGRSVAAWHGDVGQSRRKEILREPPDLLVTTPESLEVMLVSTKVDHRRFFSELQTVVVDEIHSFGSDDRGWHLLSVLSRIERLRGTRLQRVGLSATVGNPSELLEWLAMPASPRPRPKATVIQSAAGARRDAEIRVDLSLIHI